VVVNPLVEGMAPGGNPLLHGALPRFNHAVALGLVMVTPVYAYTVFQVLQATRAHLAKSGGTIASSHWRQLLSHASSILSKQRFAPTVAFFTLLHLGDYAWRSRLGWGAEALGAARLQTAVLHRARDDASELQAATLSAFTVAGTASTSSDQLGSAAVASAPAGKTAGMEAVFQTLRSRCSVDTTRASIESAWQRGLPAATPREAWMQAFASPRVPCVDMRNASHAQAEHAHISSALLQQGLPMLPFADLAVPLVALAGEAARHTPALSGGVPDFSQRWPGTNLKSLPSPGAGLIATCADSAAAVQGWCVGCNPLQYSQAAELLTSMPWYDAMLQVACNRSALASLSMGATIALTVQPLLGGGSASWAVACPQDAMLSQQERLHLRTARARVLLLAQHRLQAGAKFADSAAALHEEHSAGGDSAAGAASSFLSHRAVCAWADGLHTAARIETLQEIVQAAAEPAALEAVARALLLKSGLHAAAGGSFGSSRTSAVSCPPWALASRPVDKDGDAVVFRLPALALHPQQLNLGESSQSALCGVALASGSPHLQLLSVLQQLAWAEPAAAPTQEALLIDASGEDAESTLQPAQEDSALSALSVELVDVQPQTVQQLVAGPVASEPAQDIADKHDQHLSSVYRAVAFAAEFAQREELVQLFNGQVALQHAAAVAAANKLSEATRQAFATRNEMPLATVAPISWASAGSWSGSAPGIVSASSDLLRRPEWRDVRSGLAEHSSALQLPQMQAAAAFAMNSLPVGVEPRDTKQLLPYLQFSSLGGLVGGAAGVATSILFRKQTMAWTQAASLRRHVSIAAAVGGAVGAFTASYEESLRPLAAMFGAVQQ